MQPKRTQDRDKAAIAKKYKVFYKNFIDFHTESEADLYDSVDNESVAITKPGMGKYRQKFAKVSFEVCNLEYVICS